MWERERDFKMEWGLEKEGEKFQKERKGVLFLVNFKVQFFFRLEGKFK